MNERKRKVLWILKKIVTWFFTVTSLLIVVVGIGVYSGIDWMFKTWKNLSIDELMFHLNTSIEGANTDMIKEFVIECIVPAAIICIMVACAFFALRKKKLYYVVMVAAIVIPSLCAREKILYAMDRLDAEGYVKSQGEESKFVEKYYVSPSDVALQFPENERNLIYIFLESMETTYADSQSGGAFEENLIPELSQIARENEDFSGEDSKINGGISLYGTSWTMGGMFAQTAGIPLAIPKENRNDMETQESFFAGAITLGDILNQAGYSQNLLIGSDATFGGRRLYFTDHGNYNIYDYIYSKETGQIPSDYSVFWGYEDQKLFSFAKERLMELSKEDKPFNLTMLTVDTHFEDGYKCEQCLDEHGENVYADVMCCSSRQISEFLEWIKEQDFYENTTVIISGDHLTMDSDFCEEVDEDYQRRVFTAYINAPVTPASNKTRQYSTFDAFPTTLAALGVKIEGERLALGTNLFSERPTLTEEIGLENENEELRKKSTFLDELANIDVKSEALLRKYGVYPASQIAVDGYDYYNHVFNIAIWEIINVDEIAKVEAEITFGDDTSNVITVELTAGEDNVYRGAVDTSAFSNQPGEYHITGYVTDADGIRYSMSESVGIIY